MNDQNSFKEDQVALLGKLDADKSEWDQFVRSSPQGSIFATATYLDALGVGYDIFIGRNRDGRIDVGLPLVRGFGGLKTNPLFCKYLGVITAPSAATKASLATSQLYHRVDRLTGVLRSCRTFDYAFHPAFDNWLPFYWRGFAQQTHYTYVVGAEKRDTWWDGADSRLRRSVRRGLRDAISVERVSSFDRNNVAICYALCMRPYTKRGARPLIGLKRFMRFCRLLAPEGHIGLWIGRDCQREPVAAALVAYDNRCAYFLMNGVEQSASTGANPLLMKIVISDALSCGLAFDFEGSMLRPIEAYYRLFGGERLPYHRIWKANALNAVKHVAMKYARVLGGYER